MAYIGVQPTAGQYRKLDNISSGFNGSSTSFTTSVGGTNVTAGTAQQLIVSLGGVIQQPDTDYTVSTSTITFTTAPAAGLDFFAILMGDALNTVTPSDGSVTTAKLAGSLSLGLAAGTVSAPSLFFTGDSNNGIYSPGADQLAVTTNGTQRLIVDSTGQIEAKSLGTAAAPVWTFVDDPNTGFWSPAADTVAASTGGTERLRITSTGLVGIGTTSPDANLTLGGLTNTAGQSVDALNVNRTDGVRLFGVKWDVSTNEVRFSGNTKNFVFRNGSSEVETARIDSSGRLLVGTSSTAATIRAVFAGGDGGGSVGSVQIANTGNSLTDGQGLGTLGFVDSDHSSGKQDYARITGARDGGTWSSTSKPTRLVFSVTSDGSSSPTERMRITNSGAVRIGTVSAINAERFAIQGDGTNATATLYQAVASSIAQIYFTNSNGNVGSIFTSGSATSYNTSSDYRLKENVEPVNDGIARLQQLKPSRFNFIADPDKTVDGFIAHEVQEVVPEAISGEKDAEDENGKPIYQGIDQSKLVPLLTAALQEAIGEIESLKARLTAAGI